VAAIQTVFIEVARFKTRAGVSDQEFLAAELGVREGLLQGFPGSSRVLQDLRQPHRPFDGERGLRLAPNVNDGGRRRSCSSFHLETPC
jgi:hypothetical protein